MSKKIVTFLVVIAILFAIYYFFLKDGRNLLRKVEKGKSTHPYGLTDELINEIIERAKPKIQSDFDSLPEEVRTGIENGEYKDTIDGIIIWCLTKTIESETIAKIIQNVETDNKPYLVNQISTYIRKNYRDKLMPDYN